MFDPIAYLENPAWRVSKLGLDRIAELMERLSRPERTYRIVHVAGTNGKGSTAAFVSSVLQHAGNKVGLFTSPTIGDYASSILVNGEPIPPEGLCAVTRAVREAAEAMDDHPTDQRHRGARAVSFRSHRPGSYRGARRNARRNSLREDGHRQARRLGCFVAARA